MFGADLSAIRMLRFYGFRGCGTGRCGRCGKGPLGLASFEVDVVWQTSFRVTSISEGSQRGGTIRIASLGEGFVVVRPAEVLEGEDVSRS